MHFHLSLTQRLRKTAILGSAKARKYKRPLIPYNIDILAEVWAEGKTGIMRDNHKKIFFVDRYSNKEDYCLNIRTPDLSQ